MSEQYEKFLKKLDHKRQKQFSDAIKVIKLDDLGKYDVKELQNNKQIYRLRLGKYRIIFRKTISGNRILTIQSRGDVYKGF